MHIKLWKRIVSVFLSGSVILSLGIPLSSFAAEIKTQIVDPRVENTANPVGIDVTAPRFSWEMDSSVTGQLQTKYRILVATSEANLNSDHGDAWDSGVVTSDRSNQIAYAGTDLQSGQRYYWKAYVWDKDGNKLSSDNAYFEMGLLDKSLWDGQFISAKGLTAADVPAYSLDVDFKIENMSAGIVFGGKNGQFLMWQINAWDFRDQQKVYLRPHHWEPNAACLDQIDISSVIPWSERNDTHNIKIAVDANNVITTYIDGVQVDQRTDPGAGFGQFGIRECNDANSKESAYFSKYIVRNAADTVLFQDNLASGENPFGVGTVEKDSATEQNVLHAAPIAGDVYMRSVDGGGASMFRKDFTTQAGKTVRSARLYASALGVYDAYVNGHRVSEAALSPGYTDYLKYVMIQTYDITDLIASGSNTAGAIVGNGWYAGHNGFGHVNVYGADVAFLGQIEITYTDGSRQIIGTDDTWKSTKNGPYVSTDNEEGETYDARKEIPGWDAPGFNDASWGSTVVATKDSINTQVDIANLQYIAQIGPLVMPQDELKAKTITQPAPGTYIIDIGQNISGWVKLTIRGGHAGDRIRIRYGEMLYDDRAGDLSGTLYTENLRTAQATDYYTKKGDGVEVYEPRFTFHGFQYIEVTGYSGELSKDDVSGIFVGSDTEPAGTYNTSNEMVNQLYSNLTWSQRDNFLSIPTDCPQRDERQGWTGDSQIFARTATYNMDVDQFYKKFVYDMIDAQRADGAVRDTAPSKTLGDGGGNAGWGDAAVIVPWTMYLTYGDKQILADSYSMMTKMIDYYLTLPTASEPYIIPNCAYGDWLAIESTGNNLVSTAYFAYSTSLVAKTAQVLGNAADAAKYTQLFENIRTAFDKKFVTESTGKITGDTQTAYLLALKANLLPTDDLIQKAVGNLVERIAAADNHLTTGFLGVSELCPMLTKYGYSDLAYKLLLNTTYPSWGYEIVNGATTIWERWNSYSKELDQQKYGFNDVSMNSFNHYSYGSIGEWMYRYSAGIEADESQPGYKHIVFQPTFGGGLTYVNGSYDSVYGRIESNWTMNDGAFAYEIKVPANTTGTVYLPADSTDSLTVNGAAYTPGTTNVEGVSYVGYQGGKAVFNVESGAYSFGSNASEVTQYTVRVASSDGNVPAKAFISENGSAEKEVDLPYTGSYPSGTKVKVRVEPLDDGFAFKNWSGDATGSAPYETTVNKDIALNAVFASKGITDLALNKTVAASDSVEALPVWGVKNLVDGLLVSTGARDQGIKGYTSNGLNSTDLSGSNIRTITVDLGAAAAFNRIKLYPRTDAKTADGKSPGFPVDFKLEASNDPNFASGNTTVLTSRTAFANPGSGPAAFDFTQISARYVRLTVTKLGDRPTDDEYYRLQLAEIGVYNVDASDPGVEAVIEAINNLPATITLNDEAAVKAARDAYTALNDEQKALIGDAVLAKLQSAESAIQQLKDNNTTATTTTATTTTTTTTTTNTGNAATTKAADATDTTATAGGTDSTKTTKSPASPSTGERTPLPLLAAFAVVSSGIAVLSKKRKLGN